MEKLKEVLDKVPGVNLVASALCLVGVPFQFEQGHDTYAIALFIVGAANAWVVYRRVRK